MSKTFKYVHTIPLFHLDPPVAMNHGKASGGGSGTVNGFFAMAGCESPNETWLLRASLELVRLVTLP